MPSSGSSDSSADISQDDLLSTKRRSSLVGEHRRLTSSNIEYANLQGITPTDAQALLEKEQNREMYRQNLKRRLEEADREEGQHRHPVVRTSRKTRVSFHLSI